jgi:hypothetical protein
MAFVDHPHTTAANDLSNRERSDPLADQLGCVCSVLELALFGPHNGVKQRIDLLEALYLLSDLTFKLRVLLHKFVYVRFFSSHTRIDKLPQSFFKIILSMITV